MSFLNGEYFVAPLLAERQLCELILVAGRFAAGRPWEDVEAEARLAQGLDKARRMSEGRIGKHVLVFNLHHHFIDVTGARHHHSRWRPS